MIYYDIQKSIFSNHTLIAHTQKGICAILFNRSDEPGYIDVEEELGNLFPNQEIKGVYSEQFALKIIEQLENNINLDQILLDMIAGTKFQQMIWNNLRNIKSGNTITYSGLAEQMGMPKATRAVANAVANNPISILIPCHRVLPKAGGIGNYRWGKEMKKELLEREKINAPNR